MIVPCLVRARDGVCGQAAFEPTVDQFVILGSVGAAGINRPTDVSVVQSALNGISPSSGGPSPSLSVDGLSGPITRAAIARFQGGRIDRPDARADPGGPTMAALNSESVPEVQAANAPVAGALGTPGKGKQLADPLAVAAVVNLLGKVRIAIRSAEFHCEAARPFTPSTPVKKGDQPPPEPAQRSIRLLHGVFGLLNMNNPSAGLDNIRRVYRNMQVALNRTFETSPLIAPLLFVPNEFTAMETKAAAYTSMGGAFLDSKVRFSFPPVAANRIYICKNLLQGSEIFQISTAIHELAHFVSGRPLFVDDIVKIGHMTNDATKPAFDKISPEQKLRSAEHYGFFAVATAAARL